MLQSKGWFEQNWQYFVIGLAAVILVAVAGTYYVRSRASAGEEAAVKFARALTDYRSGNNQVALTSLAEVVEEYGGRDEAAQATFLLGKTNYRMRNYPEAIRYFEMYLSDYSKDPLTRSACRAGIAACNEDQTKYAEAAAAFDSAYNEDPKGPLAGDNLQAAMRNYLMVGDAATAKARLDEIVKEFEGTNLATRSIRLFHEHGTQG